VATAEDVIDLIMQDHREVERLFDQLDRHPARRTLLVPILSVSRDKHFGERPSDRRLSDMQQQARNVGLVGISDLAKNELEDLLRKLAGS